MFDFKRKKKLELVKSMRYKKKNERDKRFKITNSEDHIKECKEKYLNAKDKMSKLYCPICECTCKMDECINYSEGWYQKKPNIYWTVLEICYMSHFRYGWKAIYSNITLPSCKLWK